MGSIKASIRKLRERLDTRYTTLRLEDGSTARFSESDFTENFRGRANRRVAYVATDDEEAI